MKNKHKYNNIRMELIKALLVYHLEGREVKPLIWSLKANKFKLTQNDCVLEYTLYCKAKGRSDLDNTFKAIQDALNGIAYEDDKQIVKIIAQKYRNCGYDGFDLKVYEYKGD